jgi:hypothetical protein
MSAEWLDAVGKGRVALAAAALGPMRWRGRIGGGVEIVAERCTQRRLVALRRRDRIENRRPASARRRSEQLLQRADLGFQPLRLAVGLRDRPAQPSFLLARGSQGAARCAGGGIRALHGRFRRRDRSAQTVERGGGAVGIERSLVALQPLALCRMASLALLGLA